MSPLPFVKTQKLKYWGGPTEEQLAPARPWLVVYFVTIGVKSLSWMVLCVYAWLSSKPDIRILVTWFWGTFFAGRIVEFIAHRHLQQIRGKPTSKFYRYSLAFDVAFMAVMLYVAFRYS